VKLKDAMETMTLRQMATADELWREHIGPDGPKLQAALADENYYAIAAMIAAKMRADGDTTATIETALDVQLEKDDDEPGEVNGGNGGAPRLLSPATGS
jgi:hypothetical protein